MIKQTFLVFVCITIATGYYEELPGYNSSPNIENSGRPEWPVPTYYGKPQVQRRKPCSHRRSNTQASEQWVSLLRSMVKKPVDNNVLEPQALKYENVENTVDQSKASESTATVEASPKNESNTVTTTDPNKGKTYFLDRPNRRSLNAKESPNNSDEQSLSEEYDCDIDNSDSQYERDQFPKVASTARTSVDAEQKVIEMLKDCINKKQKNIEHKFNQVKGISISGSRRSMGDFDTDNDDSKSVNDADKQATDTNEKSLDAILPNTKSNISGPSDKVYEAPSFTLRPGKLLNQLQNATKTTELTEMPVSRRMPADNSRVCYACSTATNPSCWEPHTQTTIKYCRSNQNCVTKSFGLKNSLTVIRDCATSCDASSVPGLEPKYASCSVCYKDYCNSAATITYNLAIIFLITAIKCTF